MDISSNMTTTLPLPLAKSASALIDDVPTTLLESFLPGFALARRFVLATFSFDITSAVALAFLGAALFSAARFLFEYLQEFWRDLFTAEIEIPSTEYLHDQIMRWMTKHVVKDDSKRLTVSKKSTNYRYYSEDSDVDDEPLHYYPAYGTLRFWHEGRSITFSREAEDRDKGAMYWHEPKETIRLSVSGWSTTPIKKFLEACRKAYAEEQRYITTIRCLDSSAEDWGRSFSRPTRPMDTVYMDEADKVRIVADAKRFSNKAAARWYAERGIPHRRGYLFWGPPGSGKTSLSFALAGALGYDLHFLSLNDHSLSDAKLRNLFNELPAKSVILLEDIDAVGLARKDKPTKKPSDDKATPDGKPVGAPSTTSGPEKVTLSGLLNAIDGVASAEGRILIMTTNNPESLDKALVRPGRVDMQCHFGHASRAHAEQMFARFFADLVLDETATSNPAAPADKHSSSSSSRPTPPPSYRPSPATLERAQTFATLLPEGLLTPAEVQGYLLLRSEDADAALREFPAWVAEMREAKAQGRNIIRPGAAAAPNSADDSESEPVLVKREGKEEAKVDDKPASETAASPP